jgi:hypothetical protein
MKTSSNKSDVISNEPATIRITNAVKTRTSPTSAEPQPTLSPNPAHIARSMISPEPPAAPLSGQDNPALDEFLNPQHELCLLPVAAAESPEPCSGNQLSTTHHQSPSLIETQPILASAQPHKARRRGRIASLPKGPRDMVNRMLANGVPYKNIVGALDELDFRVTERNISNWATGGHREWLLEQDLVLENRLDQDHLVDHLRRDDATELPEVGLQAAATRLSQFILQKTARAENVEANLDTYSLRLR